eukprot:9977070-Lingulodinium_polyedra.AAC.1
MASTPVSIRDSDESDGSFQDIAAERPPDSPAATPVYIRDSDDSDGPFQDIAMERPPDSQSS